MVFVPFLAAAISQRVAFIVVEVFQPPKLFLETVVCYFSTRLKGKEIISKVFALEVCYNGFEPSFSQFGDILR